MANASAFRPLAAAIRGSLTGQEIAEIVTQPELGVEYETDWSVSAE